MGDRLFNGMIVCGPDGPFQIATSDRVYRFEEHRWSGPAFVRKDGELCARQPGEQSPFWPLWRRWKDQGSRVASDGMTCLIDEPGSELATRAVVSMELSRIVALRRRLQRPGEPV